MQSMLKYAEACSSMQKFVSAVQNTIAFSGGGGGVKAIPRTALLLSKIISVLDLILMEMINSIKVYFDSLCILS
jgi:hypothetical protein